MVFVKQDLLEQPINQVRQVLVENSEGQEMDWVRRITHALEDLTHALRHHVSAAEAPNGTLSTLASPNQDTVATLDRKVRQLRHEHVELLDNVGALSLYLENIRTRCIANITGGIEEREIPFIQEFAEEILHRLQTHQENEMDLFVTVLTRDEPGAGD